MSRVSPAELAVVVAIFLGTCVLGWAYQDRISAGMGFGFDGWHYGKVARLIQGDEPIVGTAPYVYRPAVPWLVAVTSEPGEILSGFVRVNLVANFLTVVLLTFWLSLWIADPRVRVVVSFLFQAHWIGPVRNSWYYSTLVDPVGHTLALAFLLLVFAWPARRWIRALVLAAVAWMGTLVRESLLFLPASLIAVELELARSTSALRALPGQLLRGLRLAWLPLLAGVCGILIAREIAEGSGYPGYRATLLWNYYTKSFTVWLYAWGITFGPVLALVLYDWKRAGRFLASQPVLLLLTLLVVPLSYLGGPDSERFLLWMSPVVLVLIGRAIESRRSILANPLVFAVLLVTEIFSLRLFWTIPDVKGCRAEPVFVFLTRIGECVREADLVSVHASPAVRELGMLQYAAVSALLIVLLCATDYRRRRRSNSWRRNRE